MSLTCFAASDQEKDIKADTLYLMATGNMNMTTTDKVYLFNQQINYQYEIHNYEFNAFAKWVYGTKKEGLTNNDFSSGIDANYYLDDPKKFNAWILGNFISSHSLGILNEVQTGVGLAYKILDYDPDFLKSIYFRLSNGIIYENSNYYAQEGEQKHYSTIRNSLRVQLNSRIPFYTSDTTTNKKPKYITISSTLF